MIKSSHLFSLFTFLFLTSIFPGFAQEVDTIEINGESFFVYPFEADVNRHSRYIQTPSGTGRKLTYNLYKEYMESQSMEVVSKKEFKKIRRQIRKIESQMGSRKYLREEAKYLRSKKFSKAIRSNPYPLLQQRFLANDDLTPMLDPIPDGKYVQLYSDFCLLNEKGECDWISDQVAGYFTMKNNVLDGEAVWVDLQGDTLKHGTFVNGVKEGEWKFERRSIEYIFSEEQAKLYIERGYPDIDTLVEYVTYKNGAKEGPYRMFVNSKYPVEEGTYQNGEPAGTWLTRKVIIKGYGQNQKRIRNNELITLKRTYESNDSMIVHPKWIRKELANIYGADDEQFNFFSDYGIPDLPYQIYEVAFEKDENLELEEEIEGAPYDLDFFEEEYYDEMDFEEAMYESEFGYDEYEARMYDQNSEKYISRGKLLDSVGGKPKYSGIYEVRYDNGQLAYRYQFDKNGFTEDTIFWDNGNAHDIITAVPDSNQYVRSIYDYDGKLYLEIKYDSLGDFIRIDKNHEVEETFVIDGYTTTSGGYGNFYFYNMFDTLDNEAMVDPTLLFHSWCAEDSSKLYSSTYFPNERRFSLRAYSVMGTEMMKEDKLYSENFESWTGKKRTVVGNLELETTSSGSFYEFYEADSIPIRHIRSDDLFSVASEHVLSKNQQPYTGPVKLNFDKKKLKFSKNEMTLSLPNVKSTSKKLEKDLARYRETGKTKYPTIMSLIDPTETSKDLSMYIFYSFFSEPLGGFFRPSSGGDYDEYYQEYRSIRGNDKNENAVMTNIEGFMVDGKPNGLWIAYDQFGKKMLEVNYLNGEANGEAKWYKYAFPQEENEYAWMEYDYNNPLRDSLPKKKTHYLSAEANFQNGENHGKLYNYTWYGAITSESNYVDGRKDGMSIERNKLLTTEANYKFGEPDGYVKTYLTLTPGDSILLYNLNFQDGMLQGESKSFHTNGKLAKRGFFLDGRPIEDYEAYDSLGFKYHYVKFKYSFPVEEKIWEENELSVRYLFDWQDSIYFEPSDITTTQSLESIIADLGLGGGYFERPYFGRKSLVNKNRIDYHMTKYYPNDTISRDGDLSDGRKVGCWKYYSYNGELLYEVDYQDSIITINDSVKFKSKGILTDFDADGNPLYQSYVIEMSSKYDCAHTDHYEIRQLYTKWEAHDSLSRMNGFVQNFYDNGTLQSEGNMKNGLPDGVWKYYDPYGKLNQYGVYVLGKRNARWLSGDLSKTKYLGDICLNPNLPELEKEIKYRENLLDIKITNYDMGKSLNTQYYDIDMNTFIDEEESEEEGDVE